MPNADIQEITANCGRLIGLIGLAVTSMTPRPSPEALLAALSKCAAAAIATIPGGREYGARFFAQRLKSDLERLGVFTKAGS